LHERVSMGCSERGGAGMIWAAAQVKYTRGEVTHKRGAAGVGWSHCSAE
jgi:hypothetical protein